MAWYWISDKLSSEATMTQFIGKSMSLCLKQINELTGTLERHMYTKYNLIWQKTNLGLIKLKAAFGKTD